MGMEVAQKLSHCSIPFRALVSSKESAKQLDPYTKDVWIADAQKTNELNGMCEGISHVFSSLGKSVSLFTGGRGDYKEIDYECNKNILEEAEKAGASRFIYCSILGSDADNTLHLAKVHYKVQQLLQKSPLSCTIIKPTGFFTGLHDLVIMGRKGIIPVVGSGKHLTNPIHHADLAAKAMELLEEGPETVEVGGPEILSRQEIARIVQKGTPRLWIRGHGGGCHSHSGSLRYPADPPRRNVFRGTACSDGCFDPSGKSEIFGFDSHGTFWSYRSQHSGHG